MDDDGPSTSGQAHSAGDWDREDLPDRVLRKAETVLAQRTDRILLVLERCTDNSNYVACLRTADTLGEDAAREQRAEHIVQTCCMKLAMRHVRPGLAVTASAAAEARQAAHHLHFWICL